MSERQFGAWIGTPMSERDIDNLLDATGYGILSLADGGDAYAIPVSVGYDGERVYLAFLEMDPPHRKTEFADATEQACLTVSDIQGRFDWENVILTGSLREVDSESDEFDDLLAALDDNAWFSSTFTRSSGVGNVRGYALDIESVTGRQKREQT